MQVESTLQAPLFSFLRGGGEMGELIRNYDWSSTPLGPPDQWPAGLKTTLGIVLNSRFPHFVFWGPALICFYNDAFRPSLGIDGKHPWALGKKGENVWEEIWSIIHPWLQQVLQKGEAVWMEDQLVGFYRNGRMEDIYWTFSYSPICNELGVPEGVFVTCAETTHKVMARRQVEQLVAERTSELEQARQSLLQSNLYLQTIIDLFKEPLQVLEPVFEQGRIVDFRYKLTNAAYAAYAQQTPAQLEGRKVGEVFPGYFETSSFSNAVEAFETGEAATFDIHYDKDGLDLYNRMSVAKLNESVVMHFTDYTTLKHLQLDLEQKVRELEQSNKSLEQFAFAASHDLKEPIRKILFFSEKLFQSYDRFFDEVGRQTFQRIRAATERMQSLVDDLLTYSQVSVRPQAVAAVDLNEVVQAALVDLDLAQKEGQATITCLPLPIVTGHSRQLQQLFVNLLSNGIKYARANTAPEITVRVSPPDAAMVERATTANTTGRLVQIDVSDNGIGFLQEEAERIFQVFQRLHGNTEYKGTGVGLAIAQKIAENHDGYIWATSVPGAGATFHVLLPAAGEGGVP